VTLFRTVFLTIFRISPMLMLAVIIGLAIIVSYMATMLNEDENQIKAHRASNAAKSRVVYALKNVPEGAEISSSDLQEREIETCKVQEDALNSSMLATGRIAKYGISAGEMLSQHDLASLEEVKELKEHPGLRKGMRAISFGVDTNARVAGFIVPGAQVDILAKVGSGADIKAQPILSDVEVLAVGQNHEKRVGPRSCSSVTSFTVALVPTDVTRLAKAITVGKLYLTLRSAQEHTPVSTFHINSMHYQPCQADRSREISHDRSRKEGAHEKEQIYGRTDSRNS
jgi:Flp pilus assembly protein CpaB